MNLRTLKASLSRFSGKKPERALRAPIDPVREWTIALLVTTLVALCLVAYTGYEFYEQLSDGAMPEVSEESIPRYRAGDAELLIQYYAGRERIYTELRTQSGAPHVEVTVSPLENALGVLESTTPPPPSDTAPTLE